MHSATVATEADHRGSQIITSTKTTEQTERTLIEIRSDPLSRDLPKEPMNGFTLHLLSSFDRKDPRIHRNTFASDKTGRFKDLARVARVVDVSPGTPIDQIPNFLRNHKDGPLMPGSLLHLLAFSIERPTHQRLYPVAAWDQWMEETVVETKKGQKIETTIFMPKDLSQNPASANIFFPVIGGNALPLREFRGDCMDGTTWNSNFQIIAYKPEH